MMKRCFFVLAVVLTVFSSCRKNRNCTCSDGSTDLGTFSYTNVTRKEAKTFCQSNQTQYQTSYPGATCTLR